jgi:hypothetical protein
LLDTGPAGGTAGRAFGRPASTSGLDSQYDIGLGSDFSRQAAIAMLNGLGLNQYDGFWDEDPNANLGPEGHTIYPFADGSFNSMLENMPGIDPQWMSRCLSDY